MSRYRVALTGRQTDALVSLLVTACRGCTIDIRDADDGEGAVEVVRWVRGNETCWRIELDGHTAEQIAA